MLVFARVPAALAVGSGLLPLRGGYNHGMRYRLRTLLIVLADCGPQSLARPDGRCECSGELKVSISTQMIEQELNSQPYVPPMFRFTIRDVLWLTVVVALAVGWWAREQQVASREKLAKTLEAQSLAELKSLNEMMFQMQGIDRRMKLRGEKPRATLNRE